MYCGGICVDVSLDANREDSEGDVPSNIFQCIYQGLVFEFLWRCVVGVGLWSWQKVNSMKCILVFWMV